ncbi:FadR/GntR family transcriptional regulator [Arthrobacter sp. G119Y2]|uniref:FadR/GntR family transcriptional regulator n=1 Tax=Arthrobacter sp. G119Y2 TaxID=3134965 RepID=UPI00311A11FD
MMRKTLVDTVADLLLDRIIAGEIRPGSALPSEADIAAESSVSRLTVREALKALRAQNVVSVQRGRGTYVNAPEEWTSLDAMIRAAAFGKGRNNTSIQLLEVRRMIETGAAALAAVRHTEDDLSQLRVHLERMVQASQAGDVDRFVAADIAFHDVILRASGNILVPAMYLPLGRLLSAGRRETSAVPEIQEHAILMHRAICDALASGNAEDARVAMDNHMDQTHVDLVHYVLDDDAVAPAAP